MIPFVLILGSAFALSLKFAPPTFQHGARFVLVAASVYAIAQNWKRSKMMVACSVALFGLGVLSSTFPMNRFPIRAILQSVVFLAGAGAYACGKLNGKRAVWWMIAVGISTAVPILTMVDPEGIISCANTSASILLSTTILSLILAPKRPLWLAIMAIMMPALYITGSRGAWLAGGILLVTYFVISKKQQSSTKLVVLIALFLISATHQGFFDSTGRWNNHWKYHLMRADLSPWTGTGLLSSYPYLAHNDYLQIQADLGYLGLSIFLVQIFTMLYEMRRGNAIFAAGAISLLLHATVDFPLMVPITYVMLCTMAGASAIEKTPASGHDLRVIAFRPPCQGVLTQARGHT